MVLAATLSGLVLALGILRVGSDEADPAPSPAASHSEQDSDAQAQLPVSSLRAAPPPQCPPERCEAIQLEGAVAELVVVTRQPTPDERLVVLDPGGPGYDGAAAGQLTDDVLPTWLRTKPLLVLREKWASNGGVPDDCIEESSDYYEWVRDDATGAPPRFDLCARFAESAQWTAGELADIATRLAQEHPAGVDVVGYSYGVQRWAGAAAVFDQDTTDADILVLGSDPGPPTGGSGAKFIEDRVDLLEVALETGSECGTDACADLLRAVEDLLPLEIPQRSVPFTGTDLLLGLAQLSYGGPEPLQAGIENLRAFVAEGDARTLTDIGRAADRATGRYGVMSHTAGSAAYLLEICSAFRDWPVFDGSDNEPSQRAFSRLYAGCGSFAPKAMAEDTSAMDCMVLNPTDPVVGGDERLSAATHVEMRPAPSHGGAFNLDEDLLETCGEP